jgi:integral membrane protein
MPLQPRERDLLRIPAALTFYKVSSIVTGTLLLLLCAEMIFKYAFGLELELGGAYGFLAFVPSDSLQAINLSLGILMIHGWGYVVYLFADFRIWSLMRWSFPKFLLIALGGIIPFLSFFLEVRVVREVKAYLASRAATADLTPESVEASH